MALNDWYLHKAGQCAQLAKEALSPELRERYESEARAWRAIAEDVAKKEPAENDQ